MRLMDADGTTQSGTLKVTGSLVSSLNSTITLPLEFPYNAASGFELFALTEGALQNSSFLGVFLLPRYYSIDPTVYYSSISLQPLDAVDNQKPTGLYAAFDTAKMGASTQYTATPEPSTYVLLCISLGVVGFVRRKLRMAN